MKAKNSTVAKRPDLLFAALLAVILLVLFWRSFLPDLVHFSNDAPLGAQNAAYQRMPDAITGMWGDLNYIGANSGSATMSVTALLHSLLSPVAFAKFFPPVTLFILGLGAWTFFRQLKLSPLACALGALASVLNSTFFSSACWGVATQEIAVGMDFFALALVIGCTPATPALVRWARIVLAGLCVGMNVIEAADIGALFSMVIAVFVLFHAVAETGGSVLQKSIQGALRVSVVAAFALFIAAQTVIALVGVSIQGVAGTAQDAQTKASQWDWATQWSLPKTETLGLAVPGLFGYKMDTPKNMQPVLQDAYRNGLYWGAVGRTPVLDRYFQNGSKGEPPSGPGVYPRFTGGGNYCGILVLLVAGWAIAQAWRRQNSIFAPLPKNVIRFWTVITLLSLLCAWGRFAPFYGILYQLPYFSTIRNPAKFVFFLSWALIIIFAYGIDAFCRLYLDPAAAKSKGLILQLRDWWSNIDKFDKQWTIGSLGILGATLVAGLIYAAEKPALISYLQSVGFPDADPTHETSAPAIAAFSLGQVVWFLALFAVAVFLLVLLISGFFAGRKAKFGMLLLGAFLVFDMGRANLPWITHWDYKEKYEVDSLTPILKTLLDKPYEHRVIGLPFRAPGPGLELFQQLYAIEWVQHHFPYYNIQSLDMVQMPRMPENIKAYRTTFAPTSEASAPLMAREWQLTNTRYLLGPATYLDLLNQELDPPQHRFRIVQRFDVLPKAGIQNPYSNLSQKDFAHYLPLEQVTAVPSPDGDYALFEFTGALPRAKLYSSWQVNTNDTAVLQKLADLNFDPQATVLVSTPEKNLPAAAAAVDPGTVAYQTYHPKHIVLSASNSAPSILLLNDQFDPQWQITVDGKQAAVLRCNYIMRGVYLPAAGQHVVDFYFNPPHRALYITCAAVFVGIILCGFLFFTRSRPPRTSPQP